MAWDGLGTFVRALEERAELVRIRKRVDPKLEVAAIADRVMKSGGPALLFENVGGSPFPLLVNAYGSRRRMSLALGVSDLEARVDAPPDPDELSLRLERVDERAGAVIRHGPAPRHNVSN